MTETATLLIDGNEYVLPVVKGTEGERAIDISRLRAETGLISIDPGYGNTGSCESAITYIDGENGILRYRGIPIEQSVAFRLSSSRTIPILWKWPGC
jgi:citrate synthase